MSGVFQKEALVSVWRQRNFAMVVAALMVVSNVILATVVMRSDEQWVLVPQFDVHDRVPVSRNRLSRAYLQKWAFSVVQDLMTANPDSIELKVHRFLLVASTEHGSLKKSLKKQAAMMKKEGFSTAYFPKSVKVRTKSVRVVGTLVTYFGGDKSPIERECVYELGYRRGPNGEVIATSLKEIRHEN